MSIGTAVVDESGVGRLDNWRVKCAPPSCFEGFQLKVQALSRRLQIH